MKEEKVKNSFTVDPSISKSEFGEFNVTYYFLFPLLEIGKYFIGNKKIFVVNCFLRDLCRKDTIRNKLLLVMKKNKETEYVYAKLHHGLKGSPHCVYSYFSGIDAMGNDLFTYVFTVPNKYLHYYRYILNGKYSKLDKGYIDIIMKSYWLQSDTKGIIKKVINKDESIKEIVEDRIGTTIPVENEIWPILSLDRETFKKC